MSQASAFGFAWMICWFASIWYAALRFELFWTGTFALILGILVAGVETSKEREKRKIDKTLIGKIVEESQKSK